MKLSQTEHNIKKQLADSKIQPSAKLWDNIQGELDKENKTSSKGLWYKLSAVAAVLCLCFLAYQGFQNTREIMPTLVLDQKNVIEEPIKFEYKTIDYVVFPADKEAKVKPSSIVEIDEPITVKQNSFAQEELANEDIKNIDNEIESLLQDANKNLTQEDQDRLIIAEVENLLDQAIDNTKDGEQKDILKSMQARLLLAEVEADIELMKPPNLKDKIWEAIVSNYTDMKNSVVLN
jgi:hypothetical protein